jgi:hypothetical protein
MKLFALLEKAIDDEFSSKPSSFETIYFTQIQLKDASNDIGAPYSCIASVKAF